MNSSHSTDLLLLMGQMYLLMWLNNISGLQCKDIEIKKTLFCFILISPESTEVTCKQSLCGAKPGLSQQLWFSAQRGKSTGCTPRQRQPDAHLHKCWNHQRLNWPRAPKSFSLFTLSLCYIHLLLRETYTRRWWTLNTQCFYYFVKRNTNTAFFDVVELS